MKSHPPLVQIEGGLKNVTHDLSIDTQIITLWNTNNNGSHRQPINMRKSVKFEGRNKKVLLCVLLYPQPT